METSILTPTQKYAAAGLFALALHQSQVHQTQPYNPLLPALEEEPIGQGAGIGNTVSVSDSANLWIHEDSGLLFPVFRILGVDEQAWDGLKETAGLSTQLRHHVGAFMTLLSDDSEGDLSKRMDKELALTNTVDATLLGMHSEASEPQEPMDGKQLDESEHENLDESGCKVAVQAVEEGNLLSYQRKVTILFELLSACVADSPDIDKTKSSQPRMGYDARHRVALRLLAIWLNVEWKEMEAMEVMVACSMITEAKGDSSNLDRNKILGRMWSNVKRGSIVGAAALTGGAVMAITGGLAAPAIAGGVSILAPVLGSALGSFYGSVAVAASFGVAGAGLTGSKMATRVGDIEEFELKEIGENHNQGRLAVGIMVSGLVLEDEDFMKPWQDPDDYMERYIVKWESQKLLALSTAIEDWLTSRVTWELMKEGAMLTVLSTLVTAVALPATLVTAADFIDSKWAVALDRADQAGKILADILLEGLQGNRPVTLAGFSLGARAIFKCLEALAEAGGDGIVERVVLLGAPVSIQGERWEDIRKMVAGRFINAYSISDWTLGVVCRATLLSQGLAGIQPIETPGIENVDVTKLVDGHSSYISATKEIFHQLDLDSYYPSFRTS